MRPDDRERNYDTDDEQVEDFEPTEPETENTASPGGEKPGRSRTQSSGRTGSKAGSSGSQRSGGRGKRSPQRPGNRSR